jgi:hypothetical protein
MTNALRAMGALDQTHRSVSIPSKTHQRKVIEFHRFEILRGMAIRPGAQRPMHTIRTAFWAMAIVSQLACGGGTSSATPGGGDGSIDSGADTAPAQIADAAQPIVDAGIDSNAAPFTDGEIDAASFPDATFTCDFHACSVYTEFCGIIPVGMSGPICVSLPQECLADRTCPCLLDAGLTTTQLGTCIVGDAGQLIMTL